MPKQNAIALLKADHAAVKKLFAQEQRATKQDDEKKQSIFHQIKDALTVHATIEEEIFYPAVKKARQEHVKDEVREGYEEHRQIKNLIAQIERRLIALGAELQARKQELKENPPTKLSRNQTEAFSAAK
jgi:hemerythrin superfamily protein